MAETSLLLIGPDGAFSESLEDYLSSTGRCMAIVDTPEKGLQVAAAQRPQLILLDAEACGAGAAEIQKMARDVPVILLESGLARAAPDADRRAEGRDGSSHAILRLRRNSGIDEDRKHLFPAIERILAREEERRDLLLKVEALKAEVERASGAVEEKILEKTHELKEHIEELNELRRSKSEFLNLLAHKMRTPLTAIMGFSEMLANHSSESGEDHDQMIKEILRSAIDLGNFLNDAIEFLQRSSGSLPLTRSEFDIVPHLQRIILERSKFYAEKKVRVAYRGLNRLTMVGDARSVTSAIERVIDNAFKFSHSEGSVEISLHEENRPPLEGGSFMILKVQDHGIGLHRTQAEKIFKPLEIYSSNTDLSLGHGLGLAIVQEVIRSHGGQIGIHSDGPNKGCLVTVELPLAKYSDSYRCNKIPLVKIQASA